MPKTNKWAFVFWDEGSLPKLVEWLTSMHFACIISPLHDRDEWTRLDIERYLQNQEKRYSIHIDRASDHWERPTGEYVVVNGHRVRKTVDVPIPQVGDRKKPHRHIIIKYDYSCERATVLSDFEGSGFRIAYFEPVKSERGYIRYFIHMDNPEKAQYERKDVVSLGGYDDLPLYEKTREDKDRCFHEVYEFLDANPTIRDIRNLSDGLRAIGREDLCHTVSARANYWRSYLWDEPRARYSQGKA